MPGVANFSPSANGLHFPNEYPPMPLFPQNVWPYRYGAGAGACGGMVFAVRDYFETRAPFPDDRIVPTADAQIFQYIATRLLDSLVSTIVFQYFEWQAQSNAVCAQRTLNDQWPVIQRELDAGRFVCLGLIEVHSGDAFQLGKNHQVLAYWYDTDVSSNTTTIRVYDPNEPDDDSTRLELRHVDPSSLHGDAIPGDVLRLKADDGRVPVNKLIRGAFTIPYSLAVPWFEVVDRPQYLADIILTTETATGAPSIASAKDTALLVAWTGTDDARHLNIARVGVDGGILDKAIFDGEDGRPLIQSPHSPALAFTGGRGYLASTGFDRRVNLTTFDVLPHRDVSARIDSVRFENFSTHRFANTSSGTGPALAVRPIPNDAVVYLAWPVASTGGRITIGVASRGGGFNDLRQLELAESTATDPTLYFTPEDKLVLSWIGQDSGQSVNVTTLSSDPRFPEEATGNKFTFPFGAQGRPGFVSHGNTRMAWVSQGAGGLGQGEINPPGSVGGGHVAHPLMSVFEPSADMRSLAHTVRGHGSAIPPIMQNRQMDVQEGVSLALHDGQCYAAFATTSVLDDVDKAAPSVDGESITNERDHRIRVGVYKHKK